MHTRRNLARAAAWLAGAALIAGLPAMAAEPFPSKPITILVPQTPGGANDVIARAIAARLGNGFGQPVIVDNKPGAGGNVGTSLVARAAPDGHTLLLTAQSAHTINPSLYRKIPFDPIKDFEPIMVVAVAPYLLAVNPNVPAKNLKELIALAKAQPGKINYASAGNGTVNHLLGEMLKMSTGIDIVHVPYRGAAAAATDVVGGQVPMTFGSFPGTMPFVRNGQLRVLGVATERRTQLAPEIPTLAETVPGLYANAWYGLFAPAGTPPEVIARIQSEVTKALNSPELKASLAVQGAETAPGTPDQLASLLKEELVRWAKIVKDSGAQLD